LWVCCAVLQGSIVFTQKDIYSTEMEVELWNAQEELCCPLPGPPTSLFLSPKDFCDAFCVAGYAFGRPCYAGVDVTIDGGDDDADDDDEDEDAKEWRTKTAA